MGMGIFKSFSAGSYHNTSQKITISAPVSDDTPFGKVELVFEENEKEFDTSTLNLFIPELFVYFFKQTNLAPSPTACVVADSSPIYIRVHNFRI